jgi:hypothetical protein
MIVLRFDNGSSTGEWHFEGVDEPVLRRMLQELPVYAAEAGSAEAVLEAHTSDGSTIGTWSRGGAAHLASEIFRERKSSPWADVQQAIQGAVMDPHPDEAAPA